MCGDILGHAADVWGSRGREFKSRQPDRIFSLQVRKSADLAEVISGSNLALDDNGDDHAEPSRIALTTTGQLASGLFPSQSQSCSNHVCSTSTRTRRTYLPPDPASRTTYLAGEIARCDFWFPLITGSRTCPSLALDETVVFDNSAHFALVEEPDRYGDVLNATSRPADPGGIHPLGATSGWVPGPTRAAVCAP
jgi:hypothetical protein